MKPDDARPPASSHTSLTHSVDCLFVLCVPRRERGGFSLPARAITPVLPSPRRLWLWLWLGNLPCLRSFPAGRSPAIARPLPSAPLAPPSLPSQPGLAVRPVCSCFGFDLFAFASSSITVQRCSNVLIIVDDHIVNLSYHYHHYHNHIVPTTPLYGNLDLRNTPLDLLY